MLARPWIYWAQRLRWRDGVVKAGMPIGLSGAGVAVERVMV